MADVFISYKREDKQVAERLSIALEQLGFEVWWDLNLISGQPYRAAIRAVIDQCKAAIVLWSEKSVLSEFVMDEASYAHRLGKLCPARIDGVDLPMGFGQTHTADMIGWDGETNHRGFQNVVSAVEARVGRKGKLGANARTPEAEAAAAELEAFKTAQYAGTAQALRAFLQHFPRGAFAGFVRGQLETMSADAAHAASVAAETAAPPPRAPPPPPPRHEPPRAAVAPTETPKQSPPWPMIAGAVAVVAIAVTAWAMWPRQNETTGEAPAFAEAPAAQGAQGQPPIITDPPAEPYDARERELEREVADLREKLNQRAAPPPATTVAPPVQQQTAAAPAPYDLAPLHAEVRRAAERARAAEANAVEAAQRGRDAAARGEASGARSPQTGFGYNSYSNGDSYAGQFAGGVRSGVGVYHKRADDPEGSLRYEGEYANDLRHGFGLYFWRSGFRYGGGFREAQQDGHGVMRYPDGRRYEGEWSDNRFNGYGVLWNAQGGVSSQGVWANGVLTTPLSR